MYALNVNLRRVVNAITATAGLLFVWDVLAVFWRRNKHFKIVITAIPLCLYTIFLLFQVRYHILYVTFCGFIMDWGKFIEKQIIHSIITGRRKSLSFYLITHIISSFSWTNEPYKAARLAERAPTRTQARIVGCRAVCLKLEEIQYFHYYTTSLNGV